MTKKLVTVFAVSYFLNLVIILALIVTTTGTGLTAEQLRVAVIFNVLAAAVETAVVWAIRQQYQRKVKTLSSKIEGIREAQEPSHLLLRPEDDLYDLAMAVNQLQSQQRHLRADMQHQNDELSLLLTHLPVGVMVIDRYRKVELANNAMGTFLETDISPQRHAYTQDIKDYELVNLISRAIDSGQTQQKTLRLAATPLERTVEATVIFAPSSGDDFFAIVLLYDITEIAAIEKMQRDFLTNASHELKTPVTAISGFAETLLDGAKDDPETLTKFLKIIHRASLRLTDLITDVLSISRIEAQASTTEDSKMVRLNAIVTEQFEVMQQSAATKHLKLVNLVDPDIKVFVEHDKLIEILKNLISNAIKYNRQDGEVTVSFQSGSSNWSLLVADTGVGIAQADQARVFERFYRVDSSRNKQTIPGTGLGLAIVLELVNSMHGQLHLDSQRGVGTTMTVTIPNQVK